MTELTREEKIKYLKECKKHLEGWKELGLFEEKLKELNHELEMIERELNLLQLPQRTIETLEIKDLIIYKYDGITCESIIDMYQDVSYINAIKGVKEFKLIQIIPHEALTILKALL